MNYKIIALDLDGTLTNSQKVITPKTKEALMMIQKKGVKVVLASGRPTYGIYKLAEELELKKYGGFVLPYNGGQVIEWSTKKIIHSQTMDPAIAKRLVGLAKSHYVNLVTYKDDTLLCLEQYDMYAKIEAAINDIRIVQPDNFEEAIADLDVPKMMMLEDADYLVKVEKSISMLLGDSCECFCSAPYFLEICPKGIDKGKSLDVLLDYLGMERKDLVAVGDSFNDKPMIEIAGLGVCMENGRDEIKEIADFVTLSNDDDGIAHMIHRFF
jgi:Cof subfamily protein (haloacid dehalogenase superfamily)